MNTIFLLTITGLLLAGCSGRVATTQDTLAPETEVQMDTALQAPELQMEDDTSSLSTDLESTVIAEEDFQ